MAETSINLTSRTKQLITDKKALLLDMNSTFMFGEDRFGVDENYAKYYNSIGGALPAEGINSIITRVFNYLDERYPKEEYRHNFPSIEQAIKTTAEISLPRAEIEKIIDTFSFHEHGHIPDEYIKALFKLSEYFILSVVIDIWSPRKQWIETFHRCGIDKLFSAASFSSDHGIVKPSPKPFELVVRQLNIPKKDCLVIGDSVERNLQGATAAGLDCILVGGASDPNASDSYPSLLEFCKKID